MFNKVYNLIILVFFIFIYSCSNESNQKKIVSNEIEVSFPFSKDTVYIHFQEGFKDDSIIIKVDRIEVLAKKIKTDNRIGFAHEFKFPLRWLESYIEVTTTNQSKTCKIDIRRSDIINTDTMSFIAISNVNRNFTYKIKSKRDMYE